MVVTWAWEICLMCMYVRICPMPKAQGPEAQGMRAFISNKSQIHILQVLCCTSIAIVTTPVG